MRGSTDSDGFAAFYQTAYRPVFRYILLQRGPRDDVEDVVADAFHQAFRAWLDGRGPRDGAGITWILTIARRVAIDHARRATHRGGSQAVEELPDRHSDEGVRETWLWFEQVSRDLSSEAREALVLRYAGGLNADEIGQVLGMSASGVRSMISRGLARIREHVEVDR